jgi:prepilin-type processing-associated H-X9-DG protein
MKSVPIMDCPAATDVPNAYGFSSMAYGMNISVEYGYDNLDGPFLGHTRALNYSSVSNSSETMLIADAADLVYNSDYSAIIGITRTTQFFDAGSAHGLHNGQCNIGWLDGHAKSMGVDSSIWAQYDSYTPNSLAFATANHVGAIAKSGSCATAACYSGAGTSTNPLWNAYVYYYLLQKP